MAEYELERGKIQFKWNNVKMPAISLNSGDTLHCWTDEVSYGQLTPGCSAALLSDMDSDKVYPLAGPIYIKDAMPGDTLAVEILSLKPDNWGWSGILPGLGLLSEDFTAPYIKHWDLSNGRSTFLREDIEIPLQPFCGTMGVCPDEPGEHPVMPPGDFGGNMDTRHLNEGATLYLPIQVEGALFAAGDCHAVQGDGEVCVTGIECPMSFSLRFKLLKDLSLPSPQFMTGKRSPLSIHDTSAGYFATTGVGPDLMRNAQDAVRRMIDWLGREKQLSPEEAYILCSVVGDLKISEIVDRPNWVISFYMPLSIFE